MIPERRWFVILRKVQQEFLAGKFLDLYLFEVCAVAIFKTILNYSSNQ